MSQGQGRQLRHAARAAGRVAGSSLGALRASVAPMGVKAAVRQWRRRTLTRLQLFWLVHFGSRPHACSSQPVMVVAPHPDDEVLGCGGLIAMKRRDQVPVQIVFVTDGAASHDGLSGRDPALVAVRRQEALQAAAILGVAASDVHFLDLPDGGLQTLAGEQRLRAVDRLRQLIDASQPGELYVPHRHDRTDDHEATYGLAAVAVQASQQPPQVFQYAVWMLWSSLLFRDFTIDELRGARRLRIGAVRDQKRQALLAHRSQWMPGPQHAQPVLEPGFLHRFCLPDEVYFQTDTAAPAVIGMGALDSGR